MRKIALSLMVVATVSAAAEWERSGTDYEALSAHTKAD